MTDTRTYILPEGMTNEGFYMEQADYWREIAHDDRAEIERLRRALAEIADPNFALLASTKADIARKALQDQQGPK